MIYLFGYKQILDCICVTDFFKEFNLKYHIVTRRGKIKKNRYIETKRKREREGEVGKEKERDKEERKTDRQGERESG